jgi:hypothetical protein
MYKKIILIALLAFLVGCGGNSSSKDNNSIELEKPESEQEEVLYSSTAPYADAGFDYTAFQDERISLNGSRSVDVNSMPLNYKWSVISSPLNSNIILSDETSILPTFIAKKVGKYEFELIVNNGKYFSMPDRVIITVLSLNNIPIAKELSFQIDEDTVYTGKLDAYDEDNNTLIFTIATNPSHGNVTIDSNGDFLYTPQLNYYGKDSFFYKVNDGFDNSLPKSVNIEVIPNTDLFELTDIIADFKVIDDYLYSVTSDGQFNIYNISNKNKILRISSQENLWNDSSSVEVDVKNDYAFITYDSAGGAFLVYDISNKSFPNLIYQNSPGCPYNMSLSDEYIFISSEKALYKIIGENNITKIDNNISGKGIFVNNYFYTSNNIYDLNDLSKKAVKYRDDESKRPTNINYPYLFLEGKDSFTIYDISEPLHPIHIKDYYLDANIFKSVLLNNKLYFLTEAGLLVIDIENPENQRYITSFMINQDFKLIDVDKDFIYLSTQDNHENSKIEIIMNDNLSENNKNVVSIQDYAIPNADAGYDMRVPVTESIFFDASNSVDRDRFIVDYLWKEGNTILSNDINFTKDDFSIGEHIITLEVTDNDGYVSTDKINVIVFSLQDSLSMEESGGIKIISSLSINNTTVITLSSGSQLGFKITNDTNRIYLLTKYEIKRIYNGYSYDVAQTSDKTLLNDGRLFPDEKVNLVFTLPTDETANYWIGTYYLIDQETGKEFTNSMTWNGTIYH